MGCHRRPLAWRHRASWYQAQPTADPSPQQHGRHARELGLVHPGRRRARLAGNCGDLALERS